MPKANELISEPQVPTPSKMRFFATPHKENCHFQACPKSGNFPFGPQALECYSTSTVRAETITELILERVGPIIIKTSLLELQTNSSNLSCKKGAT